MTKKVTLMPRLPRASSTRGVTSGSGPLSNDKLRSNTKNSPSGRRLNGAGRDIVRGALARARPGLPDRRLALDPFDRGVEGDRHRQHQQHAGEHMRAVENGAVARDQITDPGGR